jgi:hypothetical protein
MLREVNTMWMIQRLGSAPEPAPEPTTTIKIEDFGYACDSDDSHASCSPSAACRLLPRGLIYRHGERLVVSSLILSGRNGFYTNSLLVHRNIEEIVHSPPIHSPTGLPGELMRSPATSSLVGRFALTNVVFESRSSLRRLRDSAFYSCSELRSIYLPASVQEVGLGCFEQCSKLAIVMFEPGARPRFGPSPFCACPPIRFVGLPPDLQPVIEKRGLLFSDDGEEEEDSS